MTEQPKTELPKTDLPEIFPYPEIQDISTLPEFYNLRCYIIQAYPLEGIALNVVREKGNIYVRVADFKGKILDSTTFPKMTPFLEKLDPRILETIALIGLRTSTLYFSIGTEIRLVDIQISANKFCSPGYLKDFFEKQGVLVQKQIGSVTIFNLGLLEDIKKGKNPDYQGNLIFKPIVFKNIIRKEKVLPLYGVLKHEAKPAT